MAKPKKRNKGGVTHNMVSEMMKGEDIARIVDLKRFPNGRKSEDHADQMDFQFSAEGRFDSFTLACDGLEQAEALYGFPFRTETDHLFMYTKMSPAESTTLLDGYVLFIKGARLFYLAAHRGEGKWLLPGQVFPVEPEGLLDYLNRANGVLKDNTVPEQMQWVRAAQRHGLLAPEYPHFFVGMTDQGRGPWTALPDGTPQPQGFLRQFD